MGHEGLDIFDGHHAIPAIPAIPGLQVVQSHAAVEDMTGLQDETCGGRTSFSAAFSTCHEVMRHTPPESNEFILFFTDPGTPRTWGLGWIGSCFLTLEPFQKLFSRL